MRVTTAVTLSTPRSQGFGVISFYPYRGYNCIMPKVNVYLPDDLADAVRDTGLPVSSICQRALEQAVRRTTAIRQALLDDIKPDTLAVRLPSFTARLVTVVTLAADRAKTAGAAHVTTGDLLAGMIAEGGNLA